MFKTICVLMALTFSLTNSTTIFADETEENDLRLSSVSGNNYNCQRRTIVSGHTIWDQVELSQCTDRPNSKSLHLTSSGDCIETTSYNGVTGTQRENKQISYCISGREKSEEFSINLDNGQKTCIRRTKYQGIDGFIEKWFPNNFQICQQSGQFEQTTSFFFIDGIHKCFNGIKDKEKSYKIWWNLQPLSFCTNRKVIKKSLEIHNSRVYDHECYSATYYEGIEGPHYERKNPMAKCTENSVSFDQTKLDLSRFFDGSRMLCHRTRKFENVIGELVQVVNASRCQEIQAESALQVGAVLFDLSNTLDFQYQPPEVVDNERDETQKESFSIGNWFFARENSNSR